MKSHRLTTGVACCAATLFLCSLASRTSAQFVVSPVPYIVAQDDYGGENGNFGGAIRGEPYAQTFTATSSGTLFSVSAGFVVPYTPSDPYYIFQFRNTIAGGLPSSQVLASVNVPTSILSQPVGGGFGLVDLTADFSSFGISLAAGHQYAISVDVPGTFGTTIFNNFVWGFTGTPYSGGSIYYMPPAGAQSLAPGESLLFTVEAVPEPAVLGLAMPLGLLLFRTRRKHRTANIDPPSSDFGAARR